MRSLSKPTQSAGRYQLLSRGGPYRMSCEQTVWNTKGTLRSTLKGEASGTAIYLWKGSIRWTYVASG